MSKLCKRIWGACANKWTGLGEPTVKLWKRMEPTSGLEPLPEPVPNRPSSLDRLDRVSLLKLWDRAEQIFAHRTSQDLQCFREQGRWPEQLGSLHYSNINGVLHVEWRVEPEEDAGHALGAS